MEETLISNYLQCQGRTIIRIMLYLEIFHRFFKFDGIRRINVGPKFRLEADPVLGDESARPKSLGVSLALQFSGRIR